MIIARSATNRQRSRSFSMCIGKVLAITFAMTCTASAQTTIYVDDDNCPTPGAGSLVDPYCSIQDAINASVDTDTIEVAHGTYHEAIDFIGKAITLRSTDGPATTIIDATTVPAVGETVSVVRCVSEETAATVLDGFTITGGTGTTFSVHEINGGGMLNDGSSPTVTNCVFSNNASDLGAGLYNNNSNPTIKRCTFDRNIARAGGGIHDRDSNSTIIDCTFSGNNALSGGGMLSDSSSTPSVTNCLFIGNKAGYGGGMFIGYNTSPKITNCTFSGNMADYYGGGMFIDSSSPILTNCTFNGNTASNGGGGISIYIGSNPTLNNCILRGDSPDEIFNDSTSPTISYSNIEGSGGSTAWDTTLGTDGGGNIDADPVFIAPLGLDGIAGTDDDDLRLSPGSPCIDAGDYDAYITSGGGLTDLDGKDRIIDDTSVADTGVGAITYLDMGAYETGLCHADGIYGFDEFSYLNECLTGPASSLNLGCACVDLDFDEQIDLRDFAQFQLAFNP